LLHSEAEKKYGTDEGCAGLLKRAIDKRTLYISVRDWSAEFCHCNTAVIWAGFGNIVESL
jgi:hypothetical protein